MPDEIESGEKETAEAAAWIRQAALEMCVAWMGSKRWVGVEPPWSTCVDAAVHLWAMSEDEANIIGMRGPVCP